MQGECEVHNGRKRRQEIIEKDWEWREIGGHILYKIPRTISGIT
jgi:hypothetical protein